MEIYILRDGQETGPFTEEVTQSLLKQGSVLINDLAWREGLEQWSPLHSVLYPVQPPRPPSGIRPPPPPTTAPVSDDEMHAVDGTDSRSSFSEDLADLERRPEPESTPRVELVTPKQKAFLSYMGIPFTSDLTKEQAALLVNDAMESPSDPGRLTRWNEERLRLHPELFATEIQTLKENRANSFFEMVQSEGAEVCTDVTRAHCQVLVGFLDVRFPNWDANKTEALWNYFLPAINEKFPQLVNKEWKGRLKFPEGPRVAPELKRRAGVVPPRKGKSALAAIVRGIVSGMVILLVVLGGMQLAKSYPQWAESRRTAKAKASAAAKAKVPVASSSGDAKESLFDSPPANAGSTLAATNPGAASSAAAGTPTAGGPPQTGDMTDAAPSVPPAEGGDPAMNSATPPPIFDPAAPPPVPVTPPAEGTFVPQPRTALKLTKPTEVQLPFGRAKLNAGTPLKLVAQEGAMLRVKYGNTVILVPASSTDFGTPDAAPPSSGAVVPAPAPPMSVAPPAAPSAPAPSTPAPAPVPVTPPPGSKESLF